MTKRNTFIGTPHWMAPEVIQESRYDGKVRGEPRPVMRQVNAYEMGISVVELTHACALVIMCCCCLSIGLLLDLMCCC
jgi:serine/threonine protein kinase